MKKTFTILTMLIMMLAGIALTSCGDDNKDEYIPDKDLPTAARTFLSNYYPSETIVYAERDNNDGDVEYEVTLSSGDKVTFDNAGVWVDVAAPDGRSIPEGIALQPIEDYVATYYADAGINEISRTALGFEVELTNDIELRFSPEGEFYGQAY